MMPNITVKWDVAHMLSQMAILSRIVSCSKPRLLPGLEHRLLTLTETQLQKLPKPKGLYQYPYYLVLLIKKEISTN